MVRIAYKIALTYILLILVVVAAVLLAAGIRVPIALNHHMQAMERHFSADRHLEENLRESFLRAIQEILVFSVLIAASSAVIVTVLLSRRVVTPIRSMSLASKRIAEGQFRMRVDEAGNDELADLAHSFNTMARNLETTENRRMRLIGDVAHELRTPLTGIISIMEGISDGVLAPNPETFGDVLNEAERLKRLVVDLEELSFLTGDEVDIRVSEFDLRILIADAVRRIAPQYDGKNVTLRIDAETSKNTVRSDPNRVTQILQNLLHNALRYTPSTGSVSVHLKVTGDAYHIAVTDTGIGIRPDELDKIFERFYRVDVSRSRVSGGSGIGLTVSLRLAHLLHGDIVARSAGPGSGSSFTLILPKTR